jgi:hypothetical protein
MKAGLADHPRHRCFVHLEAELLIERRRPHHVPHMHEGDETLHIRPVRAHERTVSAHRPASGLFPHVDQTGSRNRPHGPTRTESPRAPRQRYLME